MAGWRRKVVVVLVIFFAGFAAGIYCSVPVPESQAQDCEIKFPASALKSDAFAKSFNVEMHSYLGIAKDATVHTSRFIKQKLGEKQTAKN